MSTLDKPLNVYITVDTETWCGGWNNIDAKFPQAFKSYIYGRTNKGDYGLPFQLKLLNEHGLKAVFFVEPLFSKRFGQTALQEVVGLIHEANQNVELHLHPEWTDESTEVIFPHIKEKREHLKYFNRQEQTELIAIGKKLLEDAGCNSLSAFRAGSFGANNDTLHAVADNGLLIDSSYNYCIPECDISDFYDIHSPTLRHGLLEVPMTTFVDGAGRRRHTQLTACSYSELKSSLSQAYQKQWPSYVLLSHSFELLKPGFTQPDFTVIDRFEKLCAFLSDNPSKFQTAYFNENLLSDSDNNVSPLQVNAVSTAKRYYEQLKRKVI